MRLSSRTSGAAIKVRLLVEATTTVVELTDEEEEQEEEIDEDDEGTRWNEEGMIEVGESSSRTMALSEESGRARETDSDS